MRVQMMTNGVGVYETSADSAAAALKSMAKFLNKNNGVIPIGINYHFDDHFETHHVTVCAEVYGPDATADSLSTL